RDHHRHDWAIDKEFRHDYFSLGLTCMPGWTFMDPSAITRWPGFNPLSTNQSGPTRSPTFTFAISTLFWPLTTATRYVPCSSVTARCGISSAFCCVPTTARTFAYWPGRKTLPGFGNCAVKRIAPVV